MPRTGRPKIPTAMQSEIDPEQLLATMTARFRDTDPDDAQDMIWAMAVEQSKTGSTSALALMNEMTERRVQAQVAQSIAIEIVNYAIKDGVSTNMQNEEGSLHHVRLVGEADRTMRSLADAETLPVGSTI